MRFVRIATLLAVFAALAIAGIAFAADHGSNERPGKGCGDRNHVHYRENECGEHGEHKDNDHHRPGDIDLRRLSALTRSAAPR